MTNFNAEAMWELMDSTMHAGVWRYGQAPERDDAYAAACVAMTRDHALYDAVIAKFLDPRLERERFMLLADRRSLDTRGQLEASDVMLDLMGKVMHRSGWNVREQANGYFNQDVPQVFSTLAQTIPERADRAGAYRAAAFMSWAQDDEALVFKTHLDRLWDVTPDDEMRRALSKAFAAGILPSYARMGSPAFTGTDANVSVDDMAVRRDPGITVRR